MSEAAEARENVTFMEAIRGYGEPKVAMMLVLGFTAGLPFLLYFSTLSVWLKESNCLLYTSPSPRDATLSRMPSSA